MSDPYIDFANSGIGRRIAGAVGLPTPARLERWQAGRQQVIEGALLLGNGPLCAEIARFASKLSQQPLGLTGADTDLPTWSTNSPVPLKAVVFDASLIVTLEDLDQLRVFFAPLLRHLQPSAHLLILGRTPGPTAAPEAQIAQRALEGFSRSLAKELRNGATLQLVYVDHEGGDALEGLLRFFLSPKSAYVSGQVLRLGAGAAKVEDWTRPLAGRKALITGAARGIGAAIAETLARDGASVHLLDVPSARSDLQALAARLNGKTIDLDICAEDAVPRLIEALPDGIDIVVHNAGIIRDKTLINMSVEQWNSVMEVNLKAPSRLTEALFESGTLANDGRVILLSSTSAIAGNRGQCNYAASKAGLIGLAQAWAPRLAARGASINAVAPGFIETHMTAQIPFALREAGRRLSSLGQGGLPQDVAEVVAWLAQPGSGAINGQVLRVCGQSLVGA
ncbi:3-oxoacyl-ACP reductase [Pseudomonas sp. dw_358]|uniref:3-oxoacyl-ACP reductase n=1 Tax=Pseudomonas sp. dw_358 TaxID=2720083 RepID=UPI001BD25F4D|nr:3-oxoacyl-ACP reductase [Pseudomonas sp. dw_358]